MTTHKGAPDLEPFYFIYTTMPDPSSAQQLAKDIVNKRLAACINILNNIHTVYEDEGTVCEVSEVGMLIKTNVDSSTDAIAFINQQHPYRTPAILTWAASCNIAFGEWMNRQLCKNTSSGCLT